MHGPLFTGFSIGTLVLRNRLVRSATYEGLADANGIPGEEYREMYENLAANRVGMITTGFSYVDRAGRAMQPFQTGLDGPEKIAAFGRVTEAVHRHGTPIIAQLAHAGRQTLRQVTGSRPVSSTRRRSIYFRQKPRMPKPGEVRDIAARFADSAGRAREAGFDGVQLHAAHGYLLHQFLLPGVNRLRGEFGVDPDTGIGTALLHLIIDLVRKTCGDDYPVLVKISGDTDISPGFYPEGFDRLISFLDHQRVTAVEISYGTMDYPMNIFRGDLSIPLVLRHNPLFRTRSRVLRALTRLFVRKFIIPAFMPFSPAYNLPYAARAKSRTDLPIISVGGFRSRSEMEAAIASGKTDLVAMSRPFLREPDFVVRMMARDGDCVSMCSNCNQCVVMCDAGRPTRCYQLHPPTPQPSERAS